ncbi:hypothetical protein SMSP2_01785 [Limihaloglobus sulfuriphilus]|uniref:Uncharacterized protein n=1 Tax=Limihaloglobus sulfuriphilus TaxID=1851148 RepID=A0A1Q2MFD8_9BACT|nr:hypothetical protein [Limihaloglobus sulfuriphilus]AQQ71411.1 hypothetical protein SMSP2_01785 [Limihaloglobus sulfuriphilus]
MEFDKASQWLLKSLRRMKLLKQLAQPMTAFQLYKRTGISRRDCSDVIVEMYKAGLLFCLNPKATRSRLFGLTKTGKSIRKQLFPRIEPYYEPDIDWNAYGYVCFSQRSAIILALDSPRSPAGIKRYLRHILPKTRISANNIRNNIPMLKARDIIRTIDTRGVYPEYELTVLGRQLQTLLRRTASPSQ